MSRIDVDAPLWDQSTFYGRFRHFFWMTDPCSALHSNSELNRARTLVDQYRAGKEPEGTTDEAVKRAMKLHVSSFHPDSGELQNVFGRMSFQVPGGMFITGAMLQFYRTVPQVVFWQWFNQSFNALVNFTNRNAKSELTVNQLGVAYVSATFSALGTALGLKRLLERSAAPIFQRFVPMMAVAAANCVNVPLMRQSELTDGVELQTEEEYGGDGDHACKSRYAAAKGISQVVTSRNAIMAPGMLTLPIIMRFMETKPWFHARVWMHMPFQVLGVGCFLVFMVPVGCALFPQRCEVKTAKLKTSDSEAYAQLVAKYGEDKIPEKLYFNKGL